MNYKQLQNRYSSACLFMLHRESERREKCKSWLSVHEINTVIELSCSTGKLKDQTRACTALGVSGMSPFFTEQVSAKRTKQNVPTHFKEQGNSGLKPKEGEVTSRPWQWPINLRGQFFSGQQLKIYLLGNPIIWWSNLVFLFLFLLIKLFVAVREQRGCQQNEVIKKLNETTMNACFWLFLGWSLHYLPFFAMGRVLYFHHYFPALIFNSLLSAVIIDYITKIVFHLLPEQYANALHHVVLGGVLATVVYSFLLFSPLAYGLDNSAAANSTSSRVKWLDSWEF